MEDDLIISTEKFVDCEEDFPGITNFSNVEPTVKYQLESSDITLVNNLSNLAPSEIKEEVMSMHTVACKLAMEENKEKTRGRILRVLL